MKNKWCLVFKMAAYCYTVALRDLNDDLLLCGGFLFIYFIKQVLFIFILYFHVVVEITVHHNSG